MAIPPLSAHADFSNNSLSGQWARDGTAAMRTPEQQKALARYCLRQNELNALSWLVVHAGLNVLDLSHLILCKSDVANLMQWVNQISFTVGLNLQFTHVDNAIDIFGAGLKDNRTITSLDMRFSLRSEYAIEDSFCKADHRVRDARPVYERLCRVLSTCSKLTELKMTADERNLGPFATLIADSSILQTLALQVHGTDKEHASEEGMQAIADALKKNPALRDLAIEGWPLSVQSVAALAKQLQHNSNLRRLALPRCEMTDEHVHGLCFGLQQSVGLRELDLTGNQVESGGAKVLSGLLSSTTLAMTCLKLNNNRIGIEGATAIAFALKENQSLLELHLKDNLIDNLIDNQGGVAIGEALAINKTLTYLDLKGNGICSEGFKAIGIGVQQHPALRMLDMRENDGILIGNCNSALLAIDTALNSNPLIQMQLPLVEYVKADVPEHMHDNIRALWKAVLAQYVSVKDEPTGSPELRPRVSEEVQRIDTTRTRYVTTTRHTVTDLTPEDGSIARLTLLQQEEILVRGNQVYNDSLERVFAIRDPRHPGQVHPAYADPADARHCSAAVRVREVSFFTSSRAPVNESTLWDFLKEGFPGHSFADQARLIAALKTSIQQEITATLRGEAPPSCASVTVVRMEAAHCDSEQESQALSGQYGALLKDYAAQSQPSLGNGRIVCLFAGARLQSGQDLAAYQFAFGETALYSYGAQARQFKGTSNVQLAPYGGGNMAQYLNSTFEADLKGDLRVDTKRVNCVLFPVQIDLSDKDGQPRSESMLAVIQVQPVAQGKQLKLDYGPDYILTPQAQATRAAMVIKSEPGSTAGRDAEHGH